MQFLLGDYSPASLERAMNAVAHHAGHVSAVPLDALNPAAALPAHRFKVMYVHSTNTYDNLPFDDMVRRDGKLYLVEARAYLNGAAVERLTADFGVAPAAYRAPAGGRPVRRVPGRARRGVLAAPVRRLQARRAAGRARRGDDAHVPQGLRKEHLDDLLAEAPDDVRFHISRGAGESFANTLPLLHPDGYLDVQDIFVSDMDDYRKGFRGPVRSMGRSWPGAGL
jgi:hypothetical protein